MANERRAVKDTQVRQDSKGNLYTGRNNYTFIARKISGHVEQTWVSIRAKLVEAQEVARRQNEERKPVQKKKDITR